MRLMRSPRWTASFCCDPRHDAARDQAGDEPHADFFAARFGGFKADEDIFVELGGVGASCALRYWPGVCLK